MKISQHRQATARGFAALISAIILSTILTALVFAESAGTFWSRDDQSDRLGNIRSRALADSCAYEALLQYEENLVPGEYPEIISVDHGAGQDCVIDSVSKENDTITISTHAVIENTYASVIVTAQLSSTGTLSLISWH